MLPRTSFSHVFLYENGSVGITGCFDVGQILHMDIRQLWKAVGFEATSKERFFSYFRDHEKGYAIEVRNPIRFETRVSPAKLKTVYSSFVPPQGAMLIDNSHRLHRLLEKKRQSALSKARRVELVRIGDEHRDLYKKLIDQYVKASYEEIDRSFAEAILNIHDRGYDPTGFFTTNKEVLTITNPKSSVIGFTTLTYKRGGSVKTGPTVLLEEYQDQGYGQATRTEIENYVREHGRRKVYCTCPQNSFAVIRYLLTAGYRVEAHLDNHYARDHGELVFGKLVGPGIQHRPLKEVSDSSSARLCGPEAFDRNDLVRSIKKLFNATWFEIEKRFAQQIVDDSLDASLTGYAEKPKWLVCLSSHGQCVGAAILLPKRGGAVKTLIVRGTKDTSSLLRLIKGAESLANEQHRRKIYFLHPIGDHQFVDLLISRRYQGEGLLREPYVAGRDVVVYSRFL